MAPASPQAPSPSFDRQIIGNIIAVDGWHPQLRQGDRFLVLRVAAWLGEESAIFGGRGAQAQVQGQGGGEA